MRLFVARHRDERVIVFCCATSGLLFNLISSVEHLVYQ